MSDAVLPGWYGKLPAMGDFATRRLPPLFVEPWDQWVAAGLGHWRESDPAWLDTYLAAPVLRFVLGPAVPFGLSPGYAGVMMPSVDRVGRYFPLTVVRPRGANEHVAPSTWLRGLEALAVAALNDDWDAERIDVELAGLSDMTDEGSTWPERGRALWWYERDGVASVPVTTNGLPASDSFTRLVAGRL